MKTLIVLAVLVVSTGAAIAEPTSQYLGGADSAKQFWEMQDRSRF